MTTSRGRPHTRDDLAKATAAAPSVGSLIRAPRQPRMTTMGASASMVGRNGRKAATKATALRTTSSKGTAAQRVLETSPTVVPGARRDPERIENVKIHVAEKATASEIRKALSIDKATTSRARRALMALLGENTRRRAR